MKGPTKQCESLKRKLKVWKIACFLIGFLFILYVYQAYIDDRRSLYFNLTDIRNATIGINNQLMGIQHDTNNSRSSEYNSDLLRNHIQSFNREHNRLTNYFNPFESNWYENNRRTYSFSIQQGFINVVDLLKLKNTTGHWSTTEADLLDMMNSTFIDYSRLLDKEQQNLNGIFERFPLVTETGSVTHSIDVEQIVKIQNEINNLSYFYLLYQRLPEEMNRLSEDEIVERLIYVLDMDEKEINEILIEEDQTLRKYNFTIYRDRSNVRGQLNGYGFINEVYFGTPPDEGDLVDRELVAENLNSLLKREYGEIDYVIYDRGINYQLEDLDPDKTQLYSYEVNLTVDGYRTEKSLMVYYNARNGNLVHFKNWYENSGGLLFDPSFYELDAEGILKPNDALTQYKNSKDTSLEEEYIETVIVWSSLSGKFELVHIYTSGLYLNAHTGKEEKVSSRGILRTFF
ncbi:hypothetical protein J2S74_003746 [Evansella vedderi]|uniref:Uncharacterized protein n=1 Tax=Evansella vedderi TaxID=38282 RepID=A0ABT9ZYK2_9BACI|nr:hypothetical protein [Evansella vedderi]MDQ0256326.1 hypothetical protein [Evansella vedderi]